MADPDANSAIAAMMRAYQQYQQPSQPQWPAQWQAPSNLGEEEKQFAQTARGLNQAFPQLDMSRMPLSTNIEDRTNPSASQQLGDLIQKYTWTPPPITANPYYGVSGSTLGAQMGQNSIQPLVDRLTFEWAKRTMGPERYEREKAYWKSRQEQQQKINSARPTSPQPDYTGLPPVSTSGIRG